MGHMDLIYVSHPYYMPVPPDLDLSMHLHIALMIGAGDNPRKTAAAIAKEK